MKKFLTIIIFLIGTLSVFGQDLDSLKVIAIPLTEGQRDSLLISIQENIYHNADNAFWKNKVGRFKVYRTSNLYNSLKLDTASGRIIAIQIGINNDKSRFEYSVCDAISPSANIIGRYELYPTGNNYNFILIDTIFGDSYQVQWSTNDTACGIWRIL